MYIDYHDRPEVNLGPKALLTPTGQTKAIPKGQTRNDDYQYEEQGRFIDYTLRPLTPKASTYVATLMSILAAQEQRVRKRKPVDQANYEAQVAALASNLAWSAIRKDARPIVYQRSHTALSGSSRFKPSWLTKAFTKVVDACIDADLIDHEVGEVYSRNDNPFAKNPASRIYTTSMLREIVRDHGLTKADFERSLPTECIILRDVKEDQYDRGKDLEYPDDEHTCRMRAELEAINEWLAQADLRFDPEYDSRGILIDTIDRRLRRIFSRNNWQSGGRLYGGFWMPMSKADRHAGLRIDGEPIATVDYCQMLPRTAYAYVGVDPAMDDIYAIPGIDDPDHRKGLKKLMGAMFFRETPITKKPRETASMLPPEPVAAILQKVTRHHAPIADLFYKGMGHTFMYCESVILISVLQELRSKGITALPIHDAVVVKQSAALVTKQVMEEASRHHLGANIGADVEYTSA